MATVKGCQAARLAMIMAAGGSAPAASHCVLSIYSPCYPLCRLLDCLMLAAAAAELVPTAERDREWPSGGFVLRHCWQSQRSGKGGRELATAKAAGALTCGLI